MMELVRRLSIRSRIFAGFGLVSLAFLGFGLNSISSLSTVQTRVQSLVDSSTPAALKSLAVSDLVKETSAALGFYLLSKDADHAGSIEAKERRIDTLLGEIAQLEAISSDPESQSILQRARAQLGELRALTPRLLELAASDAENLPAMAFANRTTNSMYREKLQQLSSLIDAEHETDMEEALSDSGPMSIGDSDSLQSRPALANDIRTSFAKVAGARRDLFYHLATLRYRWLSLNNETRLFLAFRAPQAVENLATFRAAIVNELAEVEARRELLNFEQEEALSAFQDGLDKYWSGIDRLVALHQAPDWRRDAYMVKTQVAPLVDEITTSLTGLVERQRAAMQAANDEVVEIYQSKRTAIIVSIAMAAGLVGLIAWFLARGITRPLARAAHVAERVAQGDLNNQIDIAANDEAGKLMRALDQMQHDLRQRMSEAEDVAAANLRIRRALDNVGIPVTLSGSDNNLIYLNIAARKLFEGLQQEWRRSFPDFSVADLPGKRLSDYLDDVQLATAYRAQLQGETVIDGPVAGRQMRLTASPVYDDAGDYQGRVTQWLDRTDELTAREEERERLAAEREAAAANLRIRIALDNVSSNVMMADRDRNIVYLNRSAQALFTEAAEDLRVDLPDFDAGKLLGQNIDGFHRDPSHQAGMLDHLAGTHDGEIKIGSRVMRIIANPVLDESGERLGTAVEWTDRTEEVAVEQQIQSLVEAARAGDLTHRVDEAGKQGFFKLLASGFNALLSELSDVFEEIARVMSTMADGDLRQRVKGEYRGTFAEVQGDINRTLENLQDMVGKLLATADEVGTSAEEINSGNQNLSSRTEQQASSLEQTAASLEQLTATVRNNADNAQQANQVSTSARASAQRGGDVVSQAVNAMQEINSSSNRIAEIIGVIDEIAFQTNLLALNASVEAARAGEQGRGFAVVATEVRNLASRSAGAAKEIKELIRDSLDKVETGSTLVNQSGETLQEIVDGVKRVGDIVAEISAASGEQAHGIDQVNVAVSTMDEMTQQNAALAEQTSAASQSMREHATTMRKLMGFFRTDDARPVSRPTPASAPPVVTTRTPPAPPAPTVVAQAARPAPRATPKPPPAPKPMPVANVSSAADDDEWEEF